MTRSRSRFFGATLRRLVLVMMVAQLVSVVLALALMYSFMRQTIIADARAFVDVAQSDFKTQFRDQGAAGLAREIDARVAQVDGADLVALLRGPDGQKISGNLAAWPSTISDHESWRMIELYRLDADAPEQMGLISTRLPGGYTLITGQVLQNETRLIAVSERALGWALLLGLLVTALVVALQEYLLEKRIDDFTATADAIQLGDLTRRVERNETGDAFDRLGSSVNAMLARIDGLVGELRMVTDVMAHDLRSPVSRMKAGLERAISETHDETAQAALGEAIGEADRLHHMLNIALQISRAEAGMGRDQFVRFDAGAMLNDAAEVFGPAAEDGGMEIKVNCAAPLPVLAHRDLLMQAITNLIDNALSHAKGATRIELAASQKAGMVEISVADNGPGIAESGHDHALRRFGRLDASRGQPGAGLGLSLVQTIAHLHQGSMALTPAQDGGLRVVLRLPIGG